MLVRERKQGRAHGDCKGCGLLMRNMDLGTNHERWFCAAAAKNIHNLSRCPRENALQGG